MCKSVYKYNILECKKKVLFIFFNLNFQFELYTNKGKNKKITFRYKYYKYNFPSLFTLLYLNNIRKKTNGS